MILIDGSSLTYKIYHGNKKEIISPEGEFQKNYFKHLLLSALMWRVKKLGGSKHNKVVICSDSKPYWRTEYFNSVKDEYFKDYFLTEKTTKDIDIPNYTYKGKRTKDEHAKSVWEVHTEVISFIRDYTDFIELKVKEAEADDVIAVLSKHYCKQEEVFIVAGDKDFKQLLTNENIHIYNDNPFKKKGSSDFMEEENPLRFLITHIMTGDASDNIPNIKPKLGNKTALKLFENKEAFDEMLELNPSIKFRYEVNRKMIDFNMIPDYLQQRIINEYNQEIQNNYDELNVMQYFFDNRLNDLQDRRTEFRLKEYPVETTLNTYFKRMKKDIAYNQYKDQLTLDDLF